MTVWAVPSRWRWIVRTRRMTTSPSRASWPCCARSGCRCARPDDHRPGRHAAADAALPVRFRHQHQPARPADRALFARPLHYERTLTVALQNTGYFRIRSFTSEQQADEALADGDVLFVLEIPPDFARRWIAANAPVGAAGRRRDRSGRDRQRHRGGGGAERQRAVARPAAQHAAIRRQPPFKVVVHARYNPEQITALNIVPGLIGTILMMSTLVITTLSITRERESGTMENLLAMPVRPIEVMLGKIVPYVGWATCRCC